MSICGFDVYLRKRKKRHHYRCFDGLLNLLDTFSTAQVSMLFIYWIHSFRSASLSYLATRLRSTVSITGMFVSAAQ